MATCTNELYNLVSPITTCPPDNALVLLMNVAGQPGGYASMRLDLFRQCLVSSGVGFGFLQFKIGQPGSPMNPGDDTLTISQPKVIPGSAFVSLDGVILPQDQTDQISATPIVNPTNLVVNFNQAVSNNQLYIIFYSYAK